MTYLTLSTAERISLITGLHSMRNALSRDAVKKRSPSKRAKRKKKQMTFASPEMERLFNEMPAECRKLLE